MMNTYINTSSYGGMDWHDCRTIDSFLKENGKYEITDIDAAIAKEVHKELCNMTVSTEYKDRTETLSLANVPSLETVTEYIRNNQEFTVTSDDDKECPELEASWNPEKKKLYQYYMHGQISYDLSFDIYSINADDVIYIVSENFLAPMKGVDTVQRFYQKPFTNIEDAKKALKAMQVREDYSVNGVVKELLIFDKNKISSTDWYKCNMQVIDIMEAHPELDNEENFMILVQPHIDVLKEKIAA